MIWVTPALVGGSASLILGRLFRKRVKVYKPFEAGISLREKTRRIGQVLCKDLPS